MTEYIISTDGVLHEHGALNVRERIVRCRDCKHYFMAYKMHCCARFDYEIELDGFCAWATRMEVNNGQK